MEMHRSEVGSDKTSHGGLSARHRPQSPPQRPIRWICSYNLDLAVAYLFTTIYASEQDRLSLSANVCVLSVSGALFMEPRLL